MVHSVQFANKKLGILKYPASVISGFYVFSSCRFGTFWYRNLDRRPVWLACHFSFW